MSIELVLDNLKFARIDLGNQLYEHIETKVSNAYKAHHSYTSIDFRLFSAKYEIDYVARILRENEIDNVVRGTFIDIFWCSREMYDFIRKMEIIDENKVFIKWATFGDIFTLFL